MIACVLYKPQVGDNLVLWEFLQIEQVENMWEKLHSNNI